MKCVGFALTLLLSANCFGKPDIRCVNTYLKNLKYLAAEFSQTSDLPRKLTCSGNMYMSKDKDEKKNKAVNKAKIEYTDPKYRNILIRDDIITTTDQRTGKRGSHSISRNSIYSILKGDIDLSKENCSLRGGIGNTLEVTVSISKESSITLLFSKYSNGNIKNLEGWTIRESNGNEICLRFVKGKFFVNDKTKIPDGIF